MFPVRSVTYVPGLYQDRPNSPMKLTVAFGARSLPARYVHRAKILCRGTLSTLAVRLMNRNAR